MNIILFGPPGAGKGTQSQHLKEKYSLTYFSTGDILREEMSAETEIGKKVKEGKPVYLTKNGYGSMVVLSIEQYSQLTEDIEMKLDEADRFAKSTKERLTHDEVFSNIRSQLNE